MGQSAVSAPAGAARALIVRLLGSRRAVLGALIVMIAGAFLLCPAGASAQNTTGAPQAPAHTAAAPAHKGGGEASLILPDLSSAKFMGIDGHTLLRLVGGSKAMKSVMKA